ncbi:hypothetical protein PFICI_02368 [Pestalotiopsis fici W106-1]|uniref:Major facilitator superfamily (MFS) profile domain-containing protein n=1 Tax=Pestalotiopsis fici (strain W106-1 / CGMCC3.15140) TaxID=1229662 RepID=W3XE26_PESFW|nr:uncharacterized protein PFICI_02368 [Pestalotiopsis fici W106-1]ETS84343.1 hypothetical protein PFICI_02368 [Pestalotiopsis fici W106-1]
MWGIVLIGTGFTKSFPAFVAMRVLLGVLEAPIAPGNFLVMGMWYTRKEQPLRSGLFYTGMSSFITGPLGYVVGFITNEWFSPWRALFWVVGSITIAYAIILGILLPDNPVQSKFTTEKEKFIAIDRLRADQVGVENKQWKWGQFWEAMLDIKTWILFILNVLINIPNGGLGNFTPLIIAGLGYSSRIASLLFMVVGITSTASCYMCNGAVFLANHYNPRLQVRGAAMIFGLVVAMISTIFLYTLPTTAIQNRLVALFMAYFYLGPYVVSIGLASANTAGYTKKVTVNSMIFMGWCASNIVGPFCFKTNQAPLYPFGIAAMLFSNAGSIIMTCLYILCCWSDNRQRDRKAAVEGTIPVAETEFRDFTDKQNPNFRYVW